MSNNTREIHQTDSIADAQRKISETAEAVRICREFIDTHTDRLEDLSFRCYGWDAELIVSSYQPNSYTPREIAKRFGPGGWERVAKTNQCGAFDWVKTVGGVRIIIESAETIDPKFRKDVRIE